MGVNEHGGGQHAITRQYSGTKQPCAAACGPAHPTEHRLHADDAFAFVDTHSGLIQLCDAKLCAVPLWR